MKIRRRVGGTRICPGCRAGVSEGFSGYDSQRGTGTGSVLRGISLQRKNPDIPFYQEDMFCDYSYMGAVDAITVIACLVHVDREQLPLAFEQMGKELRRESFSVRSGKALAG